MKIEHVNNGAKGYFRASENDIEAGRMTYSMAGTSMFIIDHTEVNPDFRGQNVGNQLVMEAVDFARRENLKVLPLCPFAKSVFDKTSSISDVLA